MKNLVLFSLIVVVLSSCSKNDDADPLTIVDPPFETYKYFWTEIEKKEGSSNWIPIKDGNVLRLYSDIADTASKMYGKYEYNAKNVKLNIPESYFFIKDDDSLHFYRAVNESASDPSKYVPDTLASVEYSLVGDSIMVISNKSISPIIEIKYSKQ